MAKGRVIKRRKSMKSTAAWEADLSNGLSQTKQVETPTNGTEESAPAYNKIETLKDLTFKILREVQSMREVSTPSIDDGIDFYDEVTRFEIDLIKRALLHTGGHQGRAARLLNLKITTLNSKIKHYGIELAGFAAGYAFGNAANTRSRQHA
jgi:transcriptional regulator with GAF, ATPase, and Fis domain